MVLDCDITVEGTDGLDGGTANATTVRKCKTDIHVHRSDNHNYEVDCDGGCMRMTKTPSELLLITLPSQELVPAA